MKRFVGTCNCEYGEVLRSPFPFLFSLCSPPKLNFVGRISGCIFNKFETTAIDKTETLLKERADMLPTLISSGSEALASYKNEIFYIWRFSRDGCSSGSKKSK